METDLSIRLQAYAITAEAQPSANAAVCAEALPCAGAAAAAASSGLICSHTRELRGDGNAPYLRPNQNEIDFLMADKIPGKVAEQADDPAIDETGQPPAPRLRLPLHPGQDTLTTLALGAAGIPAIKNRNV